MEPTVDKQLVNIDLSKGMDERSRPELMGSITTVENLVCDQTGAWVKRPGHVGGIVSDATSGTGTEPVYPKKIVSLVTGWGVIADGGYLLHKQEQQDKFRQRQQLMDWSATGAYIGSSGPNSISATAGAYIAAGTSCTTHDAVVQGVTAVGGNIQFMVTLYERDTGVEYSYNVPGTIGSVPVGQSILAAFVADRYLHVYAPVVVGGHAGDLNVFIIDSQSDMPATGATLTPVTIVSVGGDSFGLTDVLGGPTHAFVMMHDITTTITTVYRVAASSGSVSHSAAQTATVAYTSMAFNPSMGHLWLMAAHSSSCPVTALSSSDLSTVVADYLTTKPGTYLSVDDSDGLLFVYPTVETFGATTFAAFKVYAGAGGGAATLSYGVYGWRLISQPFFNQTASKHYVHAVKVDTAYSSAQSEIASHAIIDLSSHTGLYDVSSVWSSVRIACVLEPFNGINGRTSLLRYSGNDTDVTAFFGYQSAQRTSAVVAMRLRLSDASAYGVAQFSGSTQIAHGGINSYDGRNLVEQGFADYLFTSLAVNATAGNLNGSYRYVTVIRHVDANGASTYSRTFGPVSAVNVAAATGKNTLTIQPWGVTNRDSGQLDSIPIIELYRTKNAGTQYYLCASSQRGMSSSTTASVQQLTIDATSGLFSVQDNLSDTVLAAQAIMYRQPGTTNAPADRYMAPSCKFMVQHKDRLFCVDPYGMRVYYSSFFVDGEAAWFNPAFNFFVHAGHGPITGLASMDGRLFVFKRDLVFVVDGDGPGESGPVGNEFSPPQALASRYGCIDHRSIVNTPQGIFYRSTRGFELINRQLKVDWIGERVQNTSNAYPVTTGACLGPDARIHITIVEEENATGVYDIPGVELVYDLAADTWSVCKYTGQYTGNYPGAMQSVGVIHEDGVEKIAYAEEFFGVRVADDTTGLDLATTYVPWTIETGWIKQGPQARQRISGILLLAKKQAGANHAMRISLAYDYVDSYTQTLVWEPDVLNTLAIEELLLKPETQLVLAIRVKIEEIIPSDTGTYPVGTGLGAQLLGITAEATPVHNAPFANRGVVGQLVFMPVVSGISPASGGSGGGTPVSIFGTGFTAATLITIGGQSVTSLVYVSSNLVTAVTPSGTVGAQDVVAINSGGAGTQAGAFTYTSALFDPATLTANLWVKPAFVPASPWQSQPSEGASEWMGSFLTSGVAPTAGSLNGYAVADFAPGQGLYCSEAHSQILFTPSAGGIYVLLYPRNAQAYTGNPYDNASVISDLSSYMGIHTSASGLSAWVYDGSFKDTVPIAVGTGYHLACMRWDGVNLGMAVDSGAETTRAAGPLTFSATFSGMALGINASAGAIFDGIIAEVLCFPYTPSNTDRTNFRSYCNTKYSLSL